MILPIYTYGHLVLKKKARDIDESFPQIDVLIENMWETMYNAKGVGLAAPQIGKSIRVFIVDTKQVLDEDDQGEKGIKQVFINAEKVKEQGELWNYEEGCLSIPNIRGNVERPKILRLKYLDENFEPKEEIFDGINARVIQHEYDHLEGILFTELLKPVKRRLVRKKLDAMKKGKLSADYKVKLP